MNATHHWPLRRIGSGGDTRTGVQKSPTLDRAIAVSANIERISVGGSGGGIVPACHGSIGLSGGRYTRFRSDGSLACWAYRAGVARDPRLRNAVDLVLHDVGAVFGAAAVSVAVADEPGAVELLAGESPNLLDQLTDSRRGVRSDDIDAWIYVPGELGGVGVGLADSEHFASLVVRVAEAIQEVVVESGRFFGAAFPPCPAHPNHPLWAEVQGGEAVWACPTDKLLTVPVGDVGAPGPR